MHHESGYKVYKAGHGVIVHNTKHNFEEAHTHLDSLEQALRIIHYAKTCKKVPRWKNTYLLESIIRVCDNEEYKAKIKQLINTLNNKSKQNYVNVQRGVI